MNIEEQVWIKIPEHIYYTGKVLVRYQRPDGELYESEFYPGDFQPALEEALDQQRQEIIEELEGLKNNKLFHDKHIDEAISKIKGGGDA